MIVMIHDCDGFFCGRYLLIRLNIDENGRNPKLWKETNLEMEETL